MSKGKKDFSLESQGEEERRWIRDKVIFKLPFLIPLTFTLVPSLPINHKANPRKIVSGVK
jgi:hypothetical protein